MLKLKNFFQYPTSSKCKPYFPFIQLKIPSDFQWPADRELRNAIIEELLLNSATGTDLSDDGVIYFIIKAMHTDQCINFYTLSVSRARKMILSRL
jgi:hypothetical protein